MSLAERIAPADRLSAPQVERPSIADERRRMSDGRHLDFIGALRGIAFLGVFASHAVIFAPGLSPFLAELGRHGSSGVQLFYVLSAFTLCASLARGGTVGDYLLRRVFRIAPMFWVAIAFYLVVLGFGPRWGAPDGLGMGQVALAALLMHGFDINSLNGVVPGGWSVAIECQFYLLLPFLFLFASTLRRALVLLGAALALSILSVPAIEAVLGAFHRPSDHELVHQFAYYSLANQLPVFCLGIVAYRLVTLDSPSAAAVRAFARRRPRLVASLATLVALAIALPMKIEAGWPALIHSVPGHLGYGVAALVLLIGLMLCPGHVFNNRATRYFGKISYSAYLLHSGAMLLVADRIGPIPGLPPLARLLVVSAATLAATALGASLCYRFVEEPGIALGRKVSRRLGRAKPLVADGLSPA